MTRLHTTVTDHVAEIVLDAPPVNALDTGFLDDIIAALRAAAADDAVRAVIIASANPKVFCAGIDLNAIVSDDAMAARKLLERLYIQLADVQFNLGKPSIAAVTGAARGGGMTLSISCNVIVAGSSATFGYPEVDVGVIPAIHFAHLPRIIGRHRAFELLFSGRTFPATEARELGLVSRVVDDASVREAARTMARLFASKDPLVMQLGHAAFMRHNDYRTEIGHVTEAFCGVAATPNAKAAVRNFLARGKAGVVRKDTP
jgi:enoyl-CoA hydratase